MIQAVAFLALLQSDYESRTKALVEAVSEERMKAGETLEGLKAWRFTRVQYRMARQCPTTQEAAQNKLDRLRSTSTENESLNPTKAAKIVELITALGKSAAARHRELAQWCAAQPLPAEARRHWSQVLMHEPSNADALAALGLSGKGAAAVDPVWKDVKFVAFLADADGGKVEATPSELSKKWRSKTLRRTAMKGAIEVEGVDVSQDRLTRLTKIASADIAFWRIALGEPNLVPTFNRFVVFTGDTNYERYIEDFYDAPAKEKELSKASGGTIIPKRKEFVTFGGSTKDASLDFAVAEYCSYFVLDQNLPPWLSVGVGSLPQKLLLGRVESFSFEPPEGTDPLDKDKMWADEKKFDDAVRGQVLEGKDSDFEQLSLTKFNAMTRPQIAKSISMLRFLVMRWPGTFRALIAACRDGAKGERADLEKCLGCSLEEFDEHWRRWVIAGK